MIRPTLESDTDGLVELAWGTGVFKPLELDTLRELLGDYHAGACSGHFAVTLERGGQVIGFAYYAPTPMTESTWHLYWIAVSKDGQARGTGTELLRHVETEIARAGGRVILAETSSLPHYELTRRFYSKNDYEQEATVRDFYSPGDHQVIFRKGLAG